MLGHAIHSHPWAHLMENSCASSRHAPAVKPSCTQAQRAPYSTTRRGIVVIVSSRFRRSMRSLHGCSLMGSSWPAKPSIPRPSTWPYKMSMSITAPQALSRPPLPPWRLSHSLSCSQPTLGLSFILHACLFFCFSFGITGILFLISHLPSEPCVSLCICVVCCRDAAAVSFSNHSQSCRTMLLCFVLLLLALISTHIAPILISSPLTLCSFSPLHSCL